MPGRLSATILARPRVPAVLVLADLADSALLERAFDWLCRRRREYPADADVWTLRRRWGEEKRRLQAELRSGRYSTQPLRRVEGRDGERLSLWSARDALVLKALTWVLEGVLPVAASCTHVRGHGGAKAAVRRVLRHLPGNGLVFRTDVASYYDSIGHHRLLERLERYVTDPGILDLVRQYLRRTTERGGLFWEHRRGISRGCPLSQLMGAFFLHELDVLMAGSGLFYIRFQDDILALAPTRWKLRRAVKAINGVLERLGLEKHPDKTFVGRVERGFEFLGYRFGPQGLGIAAPTARRFVERVARLYEQERGQPGGFPALREYVRRWLRWAEAGLPAGVLSVGWVFVGRLRFLAFVGRVVFSDGEVHQLDWEPV